jgi:hypothetical protein
VKLSTVIALALLAFAAWRYFDKRPDNPDVPPVVAPSMEWQAKVSGIKSLAATKPDAAKLAGHFYRDFADVISRDAGGIVKTTGVFRTGHQKAQALFFERTPMMGSLPGFSAEFNRVALEALGKEDGALDKTKCVEMLSAVAWALGG